MNTEETFNANHDLLVKQLQALQYEIREAVPNEQFYGDLIQALRGISTQLESINKSIKIIKELEAFKTNRIDLELN